ncbi:MAG: hypothetical protein WCG25_03725 [bacterium]
MFKKILTIVSLSAIIFLAACTTKVAQPTQTPTTSTVTNNENSNTRNTCGELTEQKGF